MTRVLRLWPLMAGLALGAAPAASAQTAEALIARGVEAYGNLELDVSVGLLRRGLRSRARPTGSP